MSRFDLPNFTPSTRVLTAADAEINVNHWSGAVDSLMLALRAARAACQCDAVIASLMADLDFARCELRAHKAELVAICGG